MRTIRDRNSREEWTAAYREVRAHSLRICEPLEVEDHGIQSMPDVSPPKWHLAHTTWFYEVFLLDRFFDRNQPYDPRFRFLFNSYYKSVGAHYFRLNRGLLSRPTLAEVIHYRSEIDRRVTAFLEDSPNEAFSRAIEIVELGLNHEEQHQELLLTDIKHILCSNPIAFPYLPDNGVEYTDHVPELKWIPITEGLYQVGAHGKTFSYDNERPRHRVFLDAFEIASRLVTNGEYLEFIQDGAYSKPGLWLSLGWDTIQSESWQAPLYWEKQGDSWWTRTLNGLKPLNLNEPVSHVSYFEAEAYARWRGCRLPTEFEWEIASHSDQLQQLFGTLWQWTNSAYLPYPGFTPLEGPEGEYNGKFMCSQMVLRGSSFATPHGHERFTYRNYFPPHARWQFMGIRLAHAGNAFSMLR